MYTITQDAFRRMIDVAPIRLRMKREVRFVTSVANFDEETWERSELVTITDRSGNKGVLLLEADDRSVYLVSYELKQGMMSSAGKAQPIICDFCRTWQTGSRSGSITLEKPGRNRGSITFLCCADLQCSQHVRSLTEASRTSRAQLREDMNTDQRIERLKMRVHEIAHILGLSSVGIDEL
jgi:hypothetical protein